MGVESIRRKREVLTISCPGRGAAPHKRVHARLRRAMGRCTAGPGHKIAKTTPCKVKWAPARSTRAALRSGHEKKNGPSSRPNLISSRSIFLFEHDLFGKPVRTHRVVARGHAFPDPALAPLIQPSQNLVELFKVPVADVDGAPGVAVIDADRKAERIAHALFQRDRVRGFVLAAARLLRLALRHPLDMRQRLGLAYG